jgi:anthranilate synthase/aminodeoxychorismate synthase-like glutamine amidotransferase
LGETPLVRRHDAIDVDEILALSPSHIIISPGPCSPKEAGISTEVVRRVGPRIPILGVCLGHQCIGAAYGGEIVRAGMPMHGKTSRIHHSGTGLFAGLPNPFTATRYHSLVIAPASVPPCLQVTATSEDGEIMGLRHRRLPVEGVQNWSNAWLPSLYQGTVVRSQEPRILNLDPPPSVTPKAAPCPSPSGTGVGRDRYSHAADLT